MRAAIAILITNVLGGGTLRHAKEMVAAWSSQGHCTLLVQTAGRLVKISVFESGKCVNVHRLFDAKGKKTEDILRAYKVRILHVEHLLDAEPEWMRLHKKLGIPLVVTLHDYYTVCPFIKLTTEEDMYCGEKGVPDCNACLQRRKFIFPAGKEMVANIETWRTRWEAYLKEAALVIVPSEDMLRRIRRYYPALRLCMREDPELIGNDGGGRTIGLIGVLSKAKGAQKIKEVLSCCAERHCALHFVLFGTLQDVQLTVEEKNYITILGPYREEEVYDLIRSRSIDFFWFPGVWPETYSYTLSIPVRLALPCIATELGAIASRINANHWGETYPWELPAADIVRRLEGFPYGAYKNPDFRIRNTSFGSFEEFYRGIAAADTDSDTEESMPEVCLPDVYEEISGELTHDEFNELWQDAGIREKFGLLRHVDRQWPADVLREKGIKYFVRKAVKKIFR